MVYISLRSRHPICIVKFALKHEIGLMKWFANRLAIDLGTTRTLLYTEDRGVVINEPTMVAVQHRNGDDGHLLAVGSEAKRMLGRTPPTIAVIRPLRDGAIADLEAACAMLKYFIRSARGRRRFARLEVVIAVPAGITPIEVRAVQEAAESAGARKVTLVDASVAAALGAGLPVADPTCSMVVDIGGGTTEVSVISLAGIVSSHSVKTAGDAIDGAIQSYIKRTYNLLIGEVTAEILKTEIGDACPDPSETQQIDVKGRDLTSGIPKVLRVDSVEIAGAIAEPVAAIIKTVRSALEDIPPELSADVIDRGILLSGGGALLRNLDTRLHREVGLPLTLAEDPLRTVILGAACLLGCVNGFRQLMVRH